jgi:hypothetical protein
MKIMDDLRLCPSTSTHALVSHPLQLCHPEEPTCLRQVKSEMNAEIDIDSIGFIFCSLGEAVTLLIFREVIEFQTNLSCCFFLSIPI